MAVYPTGDVIVTGQLTGPADLGAGLLDSGPGGAVFVLALDTQNGAFLARFVP